MPKKRVAGKKSAIKVRRRKRPARRSYFMEEQWRNAQGRVTNLRRWEEERDPEAGQKMQGNTVGFRRRKRK